MSFERGIVHVCCPTTSVSKFIQAFNAQYAQEGYYLDESADNRCKNTRLRRHDAYTAALCYGLAGILFLLHRYIGLFTGILSAHTIALLCCVVCSLTIVYFGGRVYRDAAQALLNGRVNMSVLVGCVIVVLLASSIYSLSAMTFSGALLCMHHLHCPLIILGSIALRDWMLRGSTHGHNSENVPLAGASLKYKLQDNSEKYIYALQKGDVICLNDGQVVPGDGKIVSGGIKHIFDKTSTAGEPRSTRMTDRAVCAGWVYRGEATVKIELTAVKGGTQQAGYAKQAQTVFGQKLGNRARQSDRLLVWFSTGILLTAVSASVIWYCCLPSMTVMGAFQLFTAILMAVCPCALVLAEPKVYALYTAQLEPEAITVPQQLAWSDLAADPNKVVFCWDRTNTLTDPLSEDASEIRNDASQMLQAIIAQGYVRHIVMSGNDGSGMGVIEDLGFTVMTKDANIPLEEAYQLAYSGMQPEEKRDKVQALKDQGYIVIMVGDGENDLLALTYADVGVAMWHPTTYGSALPVLYGDVVLNNNLAQLPNLMRLARSAKSLSNTVMALVLGYNIACLLMVAGLSHGLFGVFVSANMAGFLMLVSIGVSVLLPTICYPCISSSVSPQASHGAAARSVLSGLFGRMGVSLPGQGGYGDTSSKACTRSRNF